MTRGGAEIVFIWVPGHFGIWGNLAVDSAAKIVFIWVPGHVGIRGNLAVDSAAKDAIDGDLSVELPPFSDPKPS